MFGKDSGTTVQTAQLTPEQRADIAAMTNFKIGTVIPTYQETVGAARDYFNASAPGSTRAAQNLAAVAGQAQDVLGTTGEAAARTSISSLQNLFSPDYERQQIEAAMAAPQSQYMTNLANQRATFGGAGQLGSARSALAEQQLASNTQAAQSQLAAKVASDINAQRMQAAQYMGDYGRGSLGQAIGAAQQGVAAAQIPMSDIAQYASIAFGLPQASYNTNFAGTQGYTKSDQNIKFGFGGPFGDLF